MNECFMHQKQTHFCYYHLVKLVESEKRFLCVCQCAVLEANNCQMESRYLGILQKLQESQELNPEQREAVNKMVKDAVQADLNTAIKLNPIR